MLTAGMRAIGLTRHSNVYKSINGRLEAIFEQTRSVNAGDNRVAPKKEHREKPVL